MKSNVLLNTPNDTVVPSQSALPVRRIHHHRDGYRGAMLRAYDKAMGAEVGAVYLPAPQSGSPMTYMLDGSQYIVLTVSGSNYSGELLAFKLN